MGFLDREGTFGLGQQVDEDDVDGHRLKEQGQEGERRLHHLGRAIGRDAPVGFDHLCIQRDIGPEFDLDDLVDGGTTVGIKHLLRQIGGAIVQHDLCACGFCALGPTGSGSGDNARPCPGGELHSEIADGARAPLDQQRLPRDITAVEHGVGRGQPGDAKAGGSVKAHVIGQRDGLRLRQGDMGRGSAEGALPLPVPDPDALAHAGLVHTVAHGLDHAGTIAMRDHCLEGGMGHAGAPASGFHIGGVHPRHGQPHQHLARSGGRGWHLGQGQHVACFAKGGIGDCAHESS